MHQLLYQIALNLIPGIGNVLAKNLVSYCGGVEAIFKQKKSRLLQIPGIGERLADHIVQFKDFKAAETEIDFITKHGITTHFYLDQNYPTRLKLIADAPVMLYSLGNANLEAEKIVGIVGTRKATEYGKVVTEQLVEMLKPLGVLVVSGLALGIDAAAHKNAIKQHLQTVGVLAHGLDRIYPAQHKNLAKQMLNNGGLLTEFPSKTNPDRENFPQRNRIVAGLSDVLVVVETGVKGGAMITAEIANTYNKEVMAVPGRASDEFSFGCNSLIKLNKANILTVPEDLLTLMGWQAPQQQSLKNAQIKIPLSEKELGVVAVIKEKIKVGIDDLAFHLQIDNGTLSLLLLDLEFKGIIRSLPGKYYELM
ncbi:MAG: DNA-protecting protein DprA [Bacteroidetes bacterium]|nr:MAG: DNA-protecting protein DprA [Bacteroidota bacterium]